MLLFSAILLRSNILNYGHLAYGSILLMLAFIYLFYFLPYCYMFRKSEFPIGPTL